MTTLLTHPLVVALATTLLHSLWLFTVLIGLGWWFASDFPEARQRYLAYLATMLSLPAAFLLVLLLEWRAQVGAWSTANLLREDLGMEATLELTGNLTALGITSQSRWLSYLAVVYLLGVVICLGLSVFRYYTTVRMRRGGWPAPPDLRIVFERLREEIVPGQRVEWKITRKVAGAMAVGVLRPVILFPVGLVNALSPSEVEAILRHELTHLLHNDPLWNAVQEMVKTLFYYHPLIHFLSRLLNREREFACDDAVSRVTDRSEYARALVRSAKFSLNPLTPFTMAAANPKHLSARIKRLFSTETGPAASRRTHLLAPLAILPLFLLFAFPPGAADANGWSGTPDDTKDWFIEGIITDCVTGQPLVGTSIYSEELETGTVTDLRGFYSLRVPAGIVELSYYYVGYNNTIWRKDINQNHYADVTLCPLEEKKKSGTLNVRRTNDKLGASLASPNGAGPSNLLDAISEDILFIVDGKRLVSGSINDIDPKDIKEIEVIKEAGKIEALGYGAGFTGAILITTKQ